MVLLIDHIGQYLAMASSLSRMALWSCSLGSRISAIVFIRSFSSRREHISTDSSATCGSQQDHLMLHLVV